VNLDERAVRDYITGNALMWLRDNHVDGLRLDAVHALHESGDQPQHILAELSAAVDALSADLGRPLTLIAESDLNDPIMITARDAGGYGIHAQWVDDWHHAAHVALTGETSGYYADFADPAALPKTWAGGFFHDGTLLVPRRELGMPVPEAVPSWRFVEFAQDHDQIGNRAAGDRLSQSLSYDRLAVAAVLTMTAPGTPMLFMGRSGVPRRRGSSSRRTPNPSSPRRYGRAARPSSPRWDGTSRSSPTRTTPRPSSAPRWTGQKRRKAITRDCSRCTGRSRGCGGNAPSSPTRTVRGTAPSRRTGTVAPAPRRGDGLDQPLRRAVAHRHRVRRHGVACDRGGRGPGGLVLPPDAAVVGPPA
jgi:maltooligosyltrehalose trehalohydrolase